MMYLNAIGQPILFLNSLKVAAELLDRRASIYSGRPRLIMAQEILSGNLVFSFLGYVDESVACCTSYESLLILRIAAGAVVGGRLTNALRSRQFLIIIIFCVKKASTSLLHC